MKPFDFPIVSNPLRTRDDVAESLLQQLRPCESHLVLGGGGLFVGNSAAHYSDRVALMEGWSRLLWGVAPLLAGGYSWDAFPSFQEGLRNGSDPESPYFWGHVPPRDQRMVEMAAISLALLIRREDFWDPLTRKEKDNLAAWLREVNHKAMSDNNWHFFRVLVNLALSRLGEEHDWEQAEEDLRFLESLYAKDGWYHDAVPFDNYNPFAFHFYSMIYYVFMKDVDKERCQRFRDRAFEFAKQYQNYFADDGSQIAYGRSLTYRYAVVSFFSACAFAGLEVLPWGVMKGIVLRNLRWWFRKPIFDSSGILTVGYAYPSLIIADNYNAPGSPYWAFKSYLMLALPEDHPFWMAEEAPMPELGTTFLECPCAVFSRHGDGDAVMLSAGQNPAFEMNQRYEKYAKFAYSAHYGFSGALSSYGFELTGCDSMLFLSEGDGYWRTRRETYGHKGCSEMVCSSWDPWEDVRITTWLIPWDDMHIRIHRIESGRGLVAKEGGFSIMRYKDHDLPSEPETMAEAGLASVSFGWGVSFIADPEGKREGSIVEPKPNLNFLQNTVAVPVLTSEIGKGISYLVTVAGASSDRDLVKAVPEITLSGDRKRIIIGGKALSLI